MQPDSILYIGKYVFSDHDVTGVQSKIPYIFKGQLRTKIDFTRRSL